MRDGNLNVLLGLGELSAHIQHLVFIISEAIYPFRKIWTTVDMVIFHSLNYGTIFMSMGNLHFSRKYWFQTFQMPIPDRLTSPKGFSVNKQACTKLNCQIFQSLLDQINVIHVHIIRFTPEERLYAYYHSMDLFR